jgi:ribose transport system ATP-binding protein
MTDAARGPRPNVVEVRGLHKWYGETHALRGVDLGIEAGEIHAIVGENGAGKSTLMKVLSGAVQPSDGAILVEGAEVEMSSPLDAFRHGVWPVYQEFSLVKHLTVAENLLMGRFAKEGRLRFNPRRCRTEASAMLRDLGFPIDPDARVDELSVSARQMVEIAKGVAERPRILILDEPSAVLGRDELASLFEIVRSLAADGSSVLYVSHRFDEVFEIADRITVLKDGSLVTTTTATDIDKRGLINLMVGRDVEDIFPDRVKGPRRTVLTVDALTREGAFSGASFELAAGEILGIFGLVGSGRTELARAIFGAEPPTSGTMLLDGEPYAPRTPRHALDRGVAYLTEDRGDDGLIMSETIRNNMTLAVLRQQTTRAGYLSPRRESGVADGQMRQLSVRAANHGVPVKHLSGGNQQKVLLARCLLTEARVLLLDEPTRGVDVPTRMQIYRTIAALVEEGVAVLVISSELVEIIGLCHRILVMREGMVVDEQARDVATERSLLAAASGVAA